MGTNKRYPYLAAQRAEENELRKARKAGPLQSLTDVQIRSHTVPIAGPLSRSREPNPGPAFAEDCGPTSRTGGSVEPV